MVERCKVAWGAPITLRIESASARSVITLKGKVMRCVQVPDPFEREKQGHIFRVGVILTHVVPDYLLLLKHMREDPLLRQGA